ncbi:MAG: hypothetical protein HY537_17295 [Deltaproteobacteria bacterium]|nr:hypothetical protein [Deltaproteobacteria bacterium]
MLTRLEQINQIGEGAAVVLTSMLYALFVKMFIGKALHDSFIGRAFPSEEEVRDNKVEERHNLRVA